MLKGEIANSKNMASLRIFLRVEKKKLNEMLQSYIMHIYVYTSYTYKAKNTCQY